MKFDHIVVNRRETFLYTIAIRCGGTLMKISIFGFVVTYQEVVPWQAMMVTVERLKEKIVNDVFIERITLPSLQAATKLLSGLKNKGHILN